MYKTIFLIPLFYLIISCKQNGTSTGLKHPTVSIDSLQHKEFPEKDTTDINIDALKSSPDNFKLLLENEYVRVLEYSLKPGQKDNTHTHPPKTSYVVSGGMLRIYPEGEKPFDYEEIKGATEWSGKRGKHYVENIGNTTVTILLTEIKSAN